jgi:hypothetical protein
MAPPRPTDKFVGPRVRARQLRRRRQRRTAAIVIGLIAMAVVGTLIAVNVKLRVERRDAVDELNLTEADVTVKRQRLERAVTDLQILTDQVARSEQASGLALLDLGRIEGTLASARETLAAQGIQVDALTSCLDGVSASVQLHGLANDGAAIDALRSVSGDCNRALVSIGGTGPVYALDFADPFVLPTSDGYYGYATNSGGGDVQVIRSADLHDWSVVGEGLAEMPNWAEENLTWAPSVLPRGNSFVLYYTVREASTDRQCISRAVAASAGGPFVDNSSSPLRCAGDGDIDASPFVDRNGRAYLYWRSSGDPLRITAQPLSSDGLELQGDPRDLIFADQSWEDGTVEGPAMVRIGDTYHLFYSGNDWNSRRYAIGHAVCETPLGPCRKTGNGPVFASTGTVVGPGGQELFLDAAGGVRLAYHAYTEPYVGYPASRRLHLATVSFAGRRAVITPG